MTFKDERGYYITDKELHDSYEILKASGDTDCETYDDYVRECCGKNGTLTAI